jgi:hypothetical protein
MRSSRCSLNNWSAATISVSSSYEGVSSNGEESSGGIPNVTRDVPPGERWWAQGP